jgi:mono/diheme cytochrome c family protein
VFGGRLARYNGGMQPLAHGLSMMSEILRKRRVTFVALLALSVAANLATQVRADEADSTATESATATAPASETPAERGYRLLTTRAYLPPDFDQEVFDQLWQTWEPPLRDKAAQATLEERRQMAFSRYGLTVAPERDSPVAWQYVDDGRGGWVMNCLACHGGKVAGQAIAGLPNSLYALQTLTEEVFETKVRLQKTPARMELGSMVMPLGGSNGTTNAVMFGVALMAHRDADLNVHPEYPRPRMVHHDHDAPAWWNVRKKTHLYADGFAANDHRALMQFLLIPQNGPEKFREWEDDYRDILAWIETLRPPAYPWDIDRSLADQGQQVFRRSCAECHGTYGADESYPNRIVPIDVVRTDRVRLDALSVQQRAGYEASWFGEYGQKPAIHDPGGYVAPPLDGIWASAPYFHNGSVPTLWHVLHPDERPALWLRTEDGYDRDRVGLEITTFEHFPRDATTAKERRRYFDARKPGKSAAGHRFPDALTEDEKRAVLEYLKTL